MNQVCGQTSIESHPITNMAHLTIRSQISTSLNFSTFLMHYTKTLSANDPRIKVLQEKFEELYQMDADIGKWL